MAVVGAGAFGGWAALWLRRAGCEVTLIDAFGPGNSRSSSGGESRVLRQYYGAERLYTELAGRARDLWRQHELEWGEELFHETALLGLVGRDDDRVARAGLATLAAEGVEVERLDPDAIAARFPAISMEGVRWGFLERRAGVLAARRACRAVARAFEALGGTLLRARAAWGASNGSSPGLRLSDGTSCSADAHVVCAGPWLAEWLPPEARSELRVTRQEIHCFGLPAGDREHAALPVWFEEGERFWYGIPAFEGRGFKVADDTPGPAFDPESGDRSPSPDGAARAREQLRLRFPALASAPLLETRVCQYTSTPDAHFVLDRHPEHPELWLAGGGSGHGFKHGPAIGEWIADAVIGRREPAPSWRLRSRTG